MKTVLMDHKVGMRRIIENKGQVTNVADQSDHGTRSHDLVFAFALTVAPILVLCLMSRANASGVSSEQIPAYVAAVIVLLLSLVIGARGGQQKL